MQSESRLVFCYPKSPPFFPPTGKWKPDPECGIPVIKEVQFTGSFSRPLAAVACRRVPGKLEFPRTTPVYICLKITARCVRVKISSSRAKIYEEHGTFSHVQISAL